MKKENVVVKQDCHSRKLLSGIYNACCCKIKGNFLLNRYVEDPRLQASGMTPLFDRGFTLIELLVVVLIIGILAAVAVPQYQKAVMKSQLSQWATYLNSFEKAERVWILANGWPDSEVHFTGDAENVGGSLDIELPCTSQSSYNCFTKIGRFHAGCKSDECYIVFATSDIDYDVPFPKGQMVTARMLADHSFNGQHALAYVPVNTTFRKLVCQWWATHYGKGRMTAEVITSCEEVGI